MEKTTIEEIAEYIAIQYHFLKAFKVDTVTPFRWGGNFHPVWIDNTLLLKDHLARIRIIKGLIELLKETGYYYDDYLVVAGTVPNGIPWATLLAQQIEKQLIYVTDRPEELGLEKAITGISSHEDLENKNIHLIDDVMSSGWRGAAAVNEIQKADGRCKNCFSIFDFGFKGTIDIFTGVVPFNTNGDELENGCELSYLLNLETLLSIWYKNGYISFEEMAVVSDWAKNPKTWAKNNGFLGK